MCSNSSLKSLSQLKTKFTWDHHGIGEKIYSNDSGQLLFFILILSAPGGGAFSGDFTTNLARQCRAFSRALKIKKLKAPLFRGPEGAGAANDWCITRFNIYSDFDFVVDIQRVLLSLLIALQQKLVAEGNDRLPETVQNI